MTDATATPARAGGALGWTYRRELAKYPRPALKYFYLWSS